MGAVMVAVAVVMIANLDVRFENAIARHLPSALVDPTSRIEQSSERLERARRPARGGPASKEGGAAEAAAGKRLPVYCSRRPTSPAPSSGSTRPVAGRSACRSCGARSCLVDFWTYTCINCIRTLPYIEAWYRKYHRDGFTVVGVHTPEFPFEKEASNVQRAIGDFGLTYPVAQDNDYATWTAYHNQYWPADYLIDATGQGAARPLRRGLLRRDRAGDPEPARRGRVRSARSAWRSAQAERPDPHATPESYLGAARAARFANGQILPGRQSFRPVPTRELGRRPARLRRPVDDRRRGGDRRADDASLELDFNARRVFCGARLAGPARARCGSCSTASPIPSSLAGPDVHGGVATISNQRLYRLVDLPRVRRARADPAPAGRDRRLRVHLRLISEPAGGEHEVVEEGGRKPRLQQGRVHALQRDIAAEREPRQRTGTSSGSADPSRVRTVQP